MNHRTPWMLPSHGVLMSPDLRSFILELSRFKPSDAGISANTGTVTCLIQLSNPRSFRFSYLYARCDRSPAVTQWEFYFWILIAPNSCPALSCFTRWRCSRRHGLSMAPSIRTTTYISADSTLPSSSYATHFSDASTPSANASTAYASTAFLASTSTTTNRTAHSYLPSLLLCTNLSSSPSATLGLCLIAPSWFSKQHISDSHTRHQFTESFYGWRMAQGPDFFNREIMPRN